MMSSMQQGDRETGPDETEADETVVVAAEGADETVVVAVDGDDKTVVVAADGADETIVVNESYDQDRTVVIERGRERGRDGGQGGDQIADDALTEPPPGAFREPAARRSRVRTPRPDASDRDTQPRVGVRRGVNVLTPIRLKGSGDSAGVTELEQRLGPPPADQYVAPAAAREGLPSLQREDRKRGRLVTLGFALTIIVSISGLAWIASIVW